MKDFIYEDITPSLIENTVMQKVLLRGVLKAYTIKSNEGFVLHDKRMDSPEYDEETFEETGNIVKGYRRSTASCPATYDFTVNPWEFYAVREIYVKNNIK